MSSTVLSDRDVNASAPQTAGNAMDKVGSDANKPKSMEYHRQVLQSRLNSEQNTSTYVSPSDTIMSPCTKKLSAYKNKHFMKAKPQSLFAKKSKPLGGFDAPKDSEMAKNSSSPTEDTTNNAAES
ncbi:MAG: hypothetical protein M1819_007205 [Sarea resinae]|nr:MAG: hypothetical protein M1819_007205 [Sarea resinae]